MTLHRRQSALLASIAVVHLALLALMLGRHLDFVFNASAHRLGPGTDFSAYWVAAKKWQAGEGMYGHGPGFGYRYHPLFIMVVGPLLTLMKGFTAHRVWVAVNEVVLLVGVVYLHRLLREWRSFAVAVALLAGWSSYYLDVYMGNSTFLVAMLSLMAFHHYRQRQQARFLILLTVAVLIKPLPLIFLPILLVRRQWASIGVVVGAFAGSAAPYFLLHPQEWQTFWRINTQAVPMAGFAIHAGTQGLHGLMVTVGTRLSGVPTAELASYAQLPAALQAIIASWPLLFVVPSLLAAWRLRFEWEAAVFLWAATYVLGYKDVWEHSYTFLLVGLAFLWISRRERTTVFLVCTIALALPTAFGLYDVRPLPPGPPDPEHGWSALTAVLHHATKPLWVLVLWVRCLRSAWRRQSPGVS